MIVKRPIVAWIMVSLSLLLTGCCAAKKNSYLYADFCTEHWQQCLPRNPCVWKAKASQWFLGGDACDTDFLNHTVAPESAMTTMSVAVPEFAAIQVDGGFQTQIYGSSHGSVDIYGPNAGVSSLSVEVLDNTVYIHAHPDALPEITKVIVRVGVPQLSKLVQNGCGPIDVLSVTSHNLAIASGPHASGDVYLSGHVRLNEVSQQGCSTINVFGVDTRDLSIQTSGRGGGVNLYGNVGVRSITHNGANDINIIGANSRSLNIYAAGYGKIGIKGFVRLKKVETHDHTEVYVSQTASKQACGEAYDCSVIGLAGSVGNLYINTYNNARFQGHSLCAQNIYAISSDCSHINLSASNKVFATAIDESSIYFFGPEYLLTRFEKAQGKILAIEERNRCNCASEYRPYDYTDMHEPVTPFCGAG